jgi:polyhydroxybutyrate depolymerase
MNTQIPMRHVERLCFIVMFLALFSLCCFSLPLMRISLPVQNQIREALIAIPSDANYESAPVIFAFHGHGGSMQIAELKFHCETLWPEAIVVYPQGLRTAGGVVDPEGRLSGWQLNVGDNADRDLLFFDQLIEYLHANYRIDDKRIYIVGHSNGAVFAYLLWAARYEKITAIGAIAGIIPTKVDRFTLKPLPIFHAGGINDPIVKYSWQSDSINFIIGKNECIDPPQVIDTYLNIYSSRIGIPVETYIDSGGHEMPNGIMTYIVNFFKEIIRE